MAPSLAIQAWYRVGIARVLECPRPETVRPKAEAASSSSTLPALTVSLSELWAETVGLYSFLKAKDRGLGWATPKAKARTLGRKFHQFITAQSMPRPQDEAQARLRSGHRHSLGWY